MFPAGMKKIKGCLSVLLIVQKKTSLPSKVASTHVFLDLCRPKPGGTSNPCLCMCAWWVRKGLGTPWPRSQFAENQKSLLPSQSHDDPIGWATCRLTCQPLFVGEMWPAMATPSPLTQARAALSFLLLQGPLSTSRWSGM